jgi:hypothetical protein
MSDFRDILDRALTDYDFYLALRRDPAQALLGYTLTTDERDPVNREILDLQSRIIIVSDARLYREGLALSLARVDRIIVVGVADSVASALICIEANDPDVVLLDFDARRAGAARRDSRGTFAS